jgi:uncharacterized protein
VTQVLDTTPAAVVGRFIDAVSVMDGEAMAAVLHPDIEVIEPDSLPFGGVYRGLDVFFNTLLPQIAGAFSLGVEDAQILAGGSTAACRMTAVYTSHRTGSVIRMPYVEVYEVVDGLIAKADVYPQDATELTSWMEANR